MYSNDKERFLKVLKYMKVLDGYASNISRCVNLKDRKISNLKSDENHILMQDILSIAIRVSKSLEVVNLIFDLSSFFKGMCSKVLDPNKLNELHSKVIITLCRMEKVFLLSFFTIMIHLLVHLVEEANLGGLVHYRWMYPIER